MTAKDFLEKILGKPTIIEEEVEMLFIPKKIKFTVVFKTGHRIVFDDFGDARRFVQDLGLKYNVL